MSEPSSPLEKIAARAGELFSLPSVAVRVLELTDNPRIDVRALKACIENDPALTAKILRVVNSSLFGLSREVTDLNQALALLGIKPLKLLVLGFSLPDALFRGVGADFLNRYWRSTLTQAVVARELAEQYWQIAGDDAFIAALLEDVGALVLAQELGEAWITFGERVRDERAELATMERKALGFTHRELSIHLLEQWRLPESLSTAIAAADAPQRMATLTRAELELAQVVRLANLTAELTVQGRYEALQELYAEGRRYRGLSETDLDELLQDLQRRVDQLAKALALELPSDFAYEQVLRDAHQRLVTVAADAAADLVRQRLQAAERDEEATLLDDVRNLSAAVTQLSASRPTVPIAARNRPAPAAPPASGASPQAEPNRLERRPDPAAADAGLLGRLAAAVASARQRRCPISLLRVEIDRPDELLMQLGRMTMQMWVERVRDLCEGLDHDPPAQCVEVDEGRWAIVCLDCDRRQAVDAARQILRGVRAATQPKSNLRLSISIGAASVAVPSPNFPPRELLAAAERCASGARASGGDAVKSIEIY